MAPVTVKLHGTLSRSLRTRKDRILVELHGPSSAQGLLEELGLPVEVVSLLYLNGEQVDLEAPVGPGDLLEAFPLLCGGSAES